jgi:tetratricopeptide (TPR) repeat protein
MDRPREEHFYATRKLGMIGADFVALSQFFPPSQSERQHWGKLLPGLDPVDELRVLTDTGYDCGAWGGFRNFRMHARSSLADVMMQMGDLEEAGRLLEEALEIERRERPEVPFLHSQSCYRYGNYLIASGRAERVLELARETEIWATEKRQSLLARAIDKLVEARARVELARREGRAPDEATSRLIDEAVEDLRYSGYHDYLIRGLVTQARILSARGQTGAARAALERALRETARGDMALLGFDAEREELLVGAARSDARVVERAMERLREKARQMHYGKGLAMLERAELQ